jgi:predicted small lipoprotein YifL
MFNEISMKNLTFVLLITLFAVSACGQKGSLYIPGSPSDPAVSKDSKEQKSEPSSDAVSDAVSDAANEAASEEDETETASE